MLSGYNHNVRHRGILFHIQTEDSGRSNPHVITHVYYGGTILASEKRGYADQLGAPDLELRVKSLMEAQHKALLQRLRRGELDPVIEDRLGSVFADGSQTQPPAGAADTPDAAGAADTPDAAVAADTPDAAVAADTPDAAVAAPAPAAGKGGSFGEGLISEKPLDEVVLEFLVENARKRKRPGK